MPYLMRYDARMNCVLPTAAEVRDRLQQLPRRRVLDLSKSTGVPFPTLVKIRNGQTINPGVETVRQFWPELVGAANEAKHAG